METLKQSIVANHLPKPTIISRIRVRRIGLIADTHIPDRADVLNPAIMKAFRKVDLILHAGDITSPVVLTELNKIAETFAVAGNNRGDRQNFDPPLPKKMIVQVTAGYRIGIYHGLEHMIQRMTDNILGRTGFKAYCTHRLLKRVRTVFNDVHCIVYGHGHWPLIQHDENLVFINPGRAFGRRESSCCVMEIRKKLMVVTFIPLSNAGRIGPLISHPHRIPLS